MPPQRGAKPGLAPTSTIERAAQHLDWSIAFGTRHDTPRGLEETTNQQSRPEPPRSARASWLRSSPTRQPRLLSISRLCLASVIIAAAAGAGFFSLTHSTAEKATAKRAFSTKAHASASGTISLVPGLATMPPSAGAAQSVTLAGPAPIPAISELEAKPTLGPLLSPSGWPKPEVAATPAKSLAAISPLTSPAPQNQPVPVFSGAEIAGLLARGDWLFATGDVASARVLFERAADAGEAQAALRLAQTFDPVYLDDPHLRGLYGDPDAAAFWYRHARDLGATGVAPRLKKLGAKEGRNFIEEPQQASGALPLSQQQKNDMFRQFERWEESQAR
jgi:hypothetical protein